MGRLLAVAAWRFAQLLGRISLFVIAVALPLGYLTGAPAYRSVSVGFYLAGSFFTVGGFFMGNRGPLRFDETRGGLLGSRVLYWASPREREDALNSSAMFVILGFVLIAFGVLADGRYSLF